MSAYIEKAACLEQMRKYNEAIKTYEEALPLEK
ncbi:MAG: hypothetical protein ACMUEL_09710 [Flavobacteriales bacterium Tduv]